MNGADLLADYRRTGSEGAFSELVGRYTNLVYSIAKRRLSNGALAEEVTQTVFTRLAKATRKFRGDAELVAWLHRTTIHVAIDVGDPISEASVRTDYNFEKQIETRFEGQTHTDAEGRFEWDSAPADEICFWFEADGYEVIRGRPMLADGSYHEIKLTRKGESPK